VLARFLAAAGHIALQQVVHLEASILGEIKRRERLKEDSKGEKKKNISTSTSVSQTPRTKVVQLYLRMSKWMILAIDEILV
jgi:condensin complex subunit 1